MDEDRTAIRRLKRGDIGGLETLVSRYQVKAVRTAFLIVHDKQRAEDIAQDTFLRLFHHINRFDENRPFGPYLLRCVVNTALDAVGRVPKQELDVEELEAVEGFLSQASTVEAQAEFNALKRKIHGALEALSPRQRSAVVMRYYLEMSEKEMAQALQAQPGTVKWHLNAARERLRILLAGERSTE